MRPASLVALFVVSIAGVQAQPADPCIPPTITSISPTSVVAGQPFTLTVNGTGFFAGSTILLNDVPLTTTFAYTTLLTGEVPKDLTKAPGAGITVQNCPGVVSPPVILPVGMNLLNVSPASLTFNYTIGSDSSPSGQTVNITSNADGIPFAATVSTSGGGNWLIVSPLNGFTPGTISVGVASLSSLPAGIYHGSISIASGQAANSPVTITVTLLITVTLPIPPAITISSIGPSAAPAGGGDFTLTVTGSNFLGISKVYWNDTLLDTAYFNSTLLTAKVPASLIAKAGVASIRVVDPIDLGPRVSNVLVFTIDPPLPPRIVRLSFAAVTCNLPVILTITGTGFLPESIVQLNGSSLSTTFDSGTQLRAGVTADLIPNAGSAEIVVINPTAASNTVSLQIAFCGVIANLDPQEAIVGGPAFTLTVNGSGFTADSLILWNDLPLQRSSSFNPTDKQIKVEVPARLIANTGQASIVVDPGKPGSLPGFFRVIAGPGFFGPFVIGQAGPAGPGEQRMLLFGINAPYPSPIVVTATLTFVDNAIATPADDPTTLLVVGDKTSRILIFTIPADSTEVPTIMVQTGTVAGIITIALVAQVNGSSADAGKVAIMIPRSPPVIRGSSLTFTPTGFEVAITGFSPERAMEKAFFQFTAPPGSKQFPDITIDVAAIFAAYYQGASSKPFGSMFTYKQAFTLEDAASAIKSVTVRLKNSMGDSNSSITNEQR